MCGFFITGNSNALKKHDFVDVHQRGIQSHEFSHQQLYAVHSVLPTATGKFSDSENDQYKMFFAGQIYNWDHSFVNDTEYVLEMLTQDIKNISKFNGMYALVLYDKQTKKIIIARDQTGQIPLYFYNKECLIVSNTIKSIVNSIDTEIDANAINRWTAHKHYISKQSVWHDISEFPAGYILINNRLERIQSVTYNTTGILQTLERIKPDYYTPLPSMSISSGGVDSSVIHAVFGGDPVCINHMGKDYISNQNDFAIDVTQKEWCEYVDEFIKQTYTIPYTWSWISYFIMGHKLQGKINVLYTGEGADEIFGGYPGYITGEPTPYSGYQHHNNPIDNKVQDQKIFIPVSTQGANLALAHFQIEPRSPFLNYEFLNNKNYLHCVNKEELKTIYTQIYNKKIQPKQGFGGFPNEYYNHVFNTTHKTFDSNNYWKQACISTISSLQ